MKSSVIIATILLIFINEYSCSLDTVANIVDVINAANSTWRASNKYVEEVGGLNNLRKRLGVKSFDNDTFTYYRRGVKLSKAINIPTSFDARKIWPKCSSISHIRDQGQCGNCWAVAACSTFSDRICIASKQKLSVKLSAQHVTFCCKECGDGCDGGYLGKTWKYFISEGTVTGGDYESKEGCQPYEIPPSDQPNSKRHKCVKNNCTNAHYNVPYKKDIYYNKNAYMLRNSEKAIQQEILKHGPVQAAFEIYNDFYYYRGGIYQRIHGAKYEGGHAVKIIGWGEEKGVKFWQCGNSWGTKWGENGTFKIRRGENECSIEENVIAGLPKK